MDVEIWTKKSNTKKAASSRQQQKKVLREDFERLCSQLFDYLSENEIPDDVFTTAYSQDNENRLIERLIHYNYLLSDTSGVVNSDDEDNDTTYGVSRTQYLDPAVLRRNMSVGDAGGEAHHIIPSCVAYENGYPKDDCNKAWNGIILPGSKKGETEIRPLGRGADTQQNEYGNAFHRKDNKYDHPRYTEVVRDRLNGAESKSDVENIAARLRDDIKRMGQGQYIDDI